MRWFQKTKQKQVQHMPANLSIYLVFLNKKYKFLIVQKRNKFRPCILSILYKCTTPKHWKKMNTLNTKRYIGTNIYYIIPKISHKAPISLIKWNITCRYEGWSLIFLWDAFLRVWAQRGPGTTPRNKTDFID